MSEDDKRWQCMVEELQGVMTIAEIAVAVEAQDRQVWRWKAGEDVPKGMNAVRLYTLHVKRCPVRQCPVGHVAEEAKPT